MESVYEKKEALCGHTVFSALSFTASVPLDGDTGRVQKGKDSVYGKCPNTVESVTAVTSHAGVTRPGALIYV